MTTLKFIAALGSGLVAGIFFAFSVFVMTALARLQPPHGIAAMQNINITVINPLFMAVFMGTALLSAGLGLAAVLQLKNPGAAWLLAACLLYLLGSFGVTVAGNVPLNDQLAAVKPESAEGALLWAHYLSAWTLWNHVRTAASLASSAAFIMSLLPKGSF